LKALIAAQVDVAAVVLRGYPLRDCFHIWEKPFEFVRVAKREGMGRVYGRGLIEITRFFQFAVLISRIRIIARYINKVIARECSREETVAAIAEKAFIPVIRTHEHNDRDCVNTLKRLRPHIFILAGASILKLKTLSIPIQGCINFHSSLLPNYRGAAPIFWQLWNGDRAGVTIHYVDEGVDTGDIILQQEMDVGPGDTIETLHLRACVLGGKLIVRALEQISNGTVQRKSQQGLRGNYYPLPTREQEALLPQRLKQRWEKYMESQ
jgi:methionyl-tRNA formyltransferase